LQYKDSALLLSIMHVRGCSACNVTLHDNIKVILCKYLLCGCADWIHMASIALAKTSVDLFAGEAASYISLHVKL
jgi:hypothetical protein